MIRIHHDALCPTTATCGTENCRCDCLCDFIADVRDDERRALAAFLVPGHAQAADNRP